MKVINLKLVQTYLIYNNLRGTPPKEFPDVDEMVMTSEEIIPVFAKLVPEFIALRKQADVLINKSVVGDIDQKDLQVKLNELQKEVRKFELLHVDEKVEVKLENAAHSKLLVQFDRWGKNWFTDIQEFIETRKALKDAESEKEPNKKGSA